MLATDIGNQFPALRRHFKANVRIMVLTFFSWLGIIHLTKLGLVLRRVVINLESCSLYSWLTVRNMPLRVRDPNIVSAAWAAPIPTMSAESKENIDSKFSNNSWAFFFFGKLYHLKPDVLTYTLKFIQYIFKHKFLKKKLRLNRAILSCC